MKSSRYIQAAIALTLLTSVGFAGDAAPPKDSVVQTVPNTSAFTQNTDGTFDLSSAAPQTPDGKPGKGSAPGQVKKASLAPEGVWTWDSFNKNMMVVRNTLTITSKKKGEYEGTLRDAAGLHPIKNVVLGDGVITFDIMVHTRGIGTFPHTYTVSLDPDQPAVSIDRPDLSAPGRAAGRKNRQTHHIQRNSGS